MAMCNLNEIVEEHMEAQPYRVCCAKCFETLNVSRKEVDDDLDLFLEVDPCEHCLEAAREEEES